MVDAAQVDTASAVTAKPDAAPADTAPKAGAAELDAAYEMLAGFGRATMLNSDDAELCAVVASAERLARRLASIQVGGAAEIADRSRPGFGSDSLSQRNGCVKPGAFLEQLLRISGAEAARRLHLGEALRSQPAFSGELFPARFPALAEAVASGEVGAESAATIVRALDAVRRVADPQDLEVAEAGLASTARTSSTDDVAHLSRVIRDRLDPDGVRPREEETRIRRCIELGRERNGIVPIRGGLAPLDAALLKSAFDEANTPGVQPRFLSPQDEIEGTLTAIDEKGDVVVTLRDIRTRAQRNHDVLVGLLKAGIRNMGTEPGQLRTTAEIVVHVSAADLESGTGLAHIDGIDEPISIATAERVACDAVFRKVVLGNDGEILAFGKSRYPFSSAQRKMFIARDGDKCLLCDAPATWGEAHHFKEYWTHGAVGRTDVDNGGIFCPGHHHFVHNSDWNFAMINGIPHVQLPAYRDPSQIWRRLGSPKIPRTEAG